MTRRVIVSFNDVITAITGDVRTALGEAAVTLFSATGNDVEELVNAFHGDTASFAYLEAAGAMPTPEMLLRAVALRSRAFESISIAVHQVDSRPGRAGVIARTNLLTPKIAGHALDALRAIHDGTRDEEESLRILRAEVHAGNGDRLRRVPEAGRDRKASEIMDTLRSEQDAFGPPEGHPLRMVPDYVTGMSERALLESIPDLVVERVRDVASRMVLAGPRP